MCASKSTVTSVACRWHNLRACNKSRFLPTICVRKVAAFNAVSERFDIIAENHAKKGCFRRARQVRGSFERRKSLFPSLRGFAPITRRVCSHHRSTRDTKTLFRPSLGMMGEIQSPKLSDGKPTELSTTAINSLFPSPLQNFGFAVPISFSCTDGNNDGKSESKSTAIRRERGG